MILGEKVNDDDEQSLRGFVRRATVNADKNEAGPVPVQIGQVRRILEDWAASLAETRVPRKRPRHVTFHLGMSPKADIDQRKTMLLGLAAPTSGRSR